MSRGYTTVGETRYDGVAAPERAGGEGMGRRAIRVGLLVGSLIALSPATADFDAGRRAWDAGRTDQALAEWRAGAAARVRSAIRHWEPADTRSNVIGFRVARTLD